MHDAGQRHKRGDAENDNQNMHQLQNLTGIISCRFIIPCPDAARADGNHCHADGHPRKHLKGCNDIGNGIRRNRRRAKACNHAQHHDFPQLKHPIFQTIGDADIGNLFQHTEIQLKGKRTLQMQQMLRRAKQQNDCNSGNDTGNKRRGCRTRNPHAKAENQDGIAAHIDGVHHHGEIHRHLGIAHSTKYCRTCVIQGDKRDGGGNDEKICFGCLHYIRLNGTEHTMQDEVSCQIQPNHNADCKQRRKQDKLIDCPICFFMLILPQILPHNNSAACCKSCKQINQQNENIIHQRDTRNCMLPYRCNHDGVGHTNQNCQKLLDNHGNNQTLQGAIGKIIRFFFDCR